MGVIGAALIAAVVGFIIFGIAVMILDVVRGRGF